MGREIRSAAAKWSTRCPPPAFAAAKEICSHYFLQASGGCSGGHISVDPGTEAHSHQRRRLMLSRPLPQAAKVCRGTGRGHLDLGARLTGDSKGKEEKLRPNLLFEGLFFWPRHFLEASETMAFILISTEQITVVPPQCAPSLSQR